MSAVRQSKLLLVRSAGGRSKFERDGDQILRSKMFPILVRLQQGNKMIGTQLDAGVKFLLIIYMPFSTLDGR